MNPQEVEKRNLAGPWLNLIVAPCPLQPLVKLACSTAYPCFSPPLVFNSLIKYWCEGTRGEQLNTALRSSSGPLRWGSTQLSG